MSEQRQTDTVGAVDQAVRTIQSEPPVPQVADVEIVDPDNIIADMKRQLAEMQARDRQLEEEAKREREARQRAEAARQQAEERARQVDTQARSTVEEAQRSTVDTQLTAITGNIQSRTVERDSLKRDYAAAGAEGDFNKMADIQSRMARLEAELSQLENGKAALEARKATPTQPDQQPATTPPNEYESQERFIGQQPPIVQGWLRQHRDRYFGDPSFQAKVAAAASYASNIKGIRGDTQDFIDFVETEVGMRAAASPPLAPAPASRDVTPPPAAPPQNPGSRMTAAPAANSAPGMSSTPTQVYLSAEEKSLAHDIGHAMGWSDAQAETEYAKGKLLDTNRGGRR